MTSSQTKHKNIVKKVRPTKTRSSPRFKSTSSQPRGGVGLKELPTSMSLVAVAQASVIGSSLAFVEGPTGCEGASDVLAATSPAEVVEWLVVAPTIAAVVEELVDVVVITKVEDSEVVIARPLRKRLKIERKMSKFLVNQVLMKIKQKTKLSIPLLQPQVSRSQCRSFPSRHFSAKCPGRSSS